MGGVCTKNNNISNDETNLARYDDLRKGDDGALYIIEKKFVNKIFLFKFSLFLN